MEKYDVIGDIHGCYEEFVELTKKLGYSWVEGHPVHPDGRRIVSLGDLTDRGPESIKVMELFWKMAVDLNIAHYTPGNHCDKLYRFFLGRNVQIKNGLETTVEEYKNLPDKQKRAVSAHFMKLYEKAPLYLQLDDGRLIVAHAGIRGDYIGKTSKKVKTFVLYGDITGESNPDGTPVRRDWARHYHGDAVIVYGHTPVNEPRKINNTYNIDTGAVFGGKLTALRYPEMELVSVPSAMPEFPEKFRSFDE